jgi:signal transduction histidine kinase/ligand-binding sensor domain-containing protein
MVTSVGVRPWPWLAALLVTLSLCESHVHARGFTNVRNVGDLRRVQALTTDSFGFVWSSSASGVCRTDGRAWECPSIEPATAIAADANGKLWAARSDGSLSYIAIFGTLAVRPSPVKGNVIGLLLTTSGELLVASRSGLFRIASAIRCADTGDCSGNLIFDGPVTAIASRDRSVLVSSADALYWISGSSIQRSVKTGKSVIAICAVGNDEWIVATGDLSSQRGTPSEIHTLKDGTLGSSGLKLSAHIRSIQVRGDTAYVATFGMGLRQFYLRPNQEHATTNATAINGVVHHELTSLTLDRQGDLWVGTEAGVSHIRFEYPLRSFTQNERLPSSSIFSLSEGIGGQIWMATIDGVSVWHPHKRDNHGEGVFETIGLSQGFKYLDIRSVAAIGEDVWVAGMSSGLFNVRTGHPQAVAGEFPLQGGVRAIRARHAGGLFIAPSVGGVGWIENGQWNEVLAPDPVATNRVMDLAEASDSAIWLAFEKGGVARLANGRMVRYLEEMADIEMLTLLPIADGGVLVGTMGAGLIRIHGNRVSRLTVEEGLPDMSIFSLIRDGESRVWMTGPRSISVVERFLIDRAFADPSVRLDVISFGPPDGVPGEPARSFFNASLVAKDGYLWFATIGGLVQIDPHAIVKAPISDGPIVDDIRINGIRFGSADATTSNSYHIEANISTPYYRHPDRIAHSYRLEGLSRDWQPATDGELRIARVPPGNYTLRVSSQITGYPLREHRVDIALPRLWYQRWQIRLLLFLASSAGVIAIFRARMNRFRREQESVLAERGRIAQDIHDSLEQDLAGLRMQLQAASMALGEREPGALGYLLRSNQLLDDAAVDLRNSIWGLRLGRLQSNEAITMLREKLIRSTSGTTVEIDVRQLGPNRLIAARIAPHLLAIAREAVANALKHADPLHIEVVLDLQSPSELALRVRDDGCKRSDGRETDGSGLGLASIRARARAMNGTFSANTGPDGKGTTIAVRIPAAEPAS